MPVASTDLSEIDRDRLQQTVDAIVASGHLGQSDRRARLLQYLVGAESNGEGDRIKAFNIAVDVFDRDASFDPNTDSIVRAEMRRLRDGLRLFYAETHNPDLLVIDIPKGSYRPRLKPPAQPSHRRPLPWRAATIAFLLAAAFLIGWHLLRAAPPARDGPVDLVRISVMPFDSDGDHPDVEEIAFGLYSELAMDLSAYPWIAVVSPLPEDEADPADWADFVLRSSLLWQGDRLLTNTQLQDVPDGSLIWSKSQSITTRVAEIEDIQREITRGIVSSLGSVRGISPDLVRLRNARNSTADLDAFLCVLGLYHYVATPTTEEHLELRTCLERVTAAFPSYGEAWAGLGVIYMDEARFGRNPRPGAVLWQDAREAIDTGLTLAPLRAPTLQAALILAIEAPERDLDAAARHALKMLDLFPRNPATLALIGSRLAEFLGRWDQGLSLIEEARSLEHDPPSFFYLTHAYRAAMGTDDLAFQAAVAPLTTMSSIPELLLNHLAASRTGSDEEVALYRAALAEQGLPSEEDIVRFVSNRRYHADLEARLLSRIQSAFRS